MIFSVSALLFNTSVIAFSPKDSHCFFETHIFRFYSWHQTSCEKSIHVSVDSIPVRRYLTDFCPVRMRYLPLTLHCNASLDILFLLVSISLSFWSPIECRVDCPFRHSVSCLCIKFYIIVSVVIIILNV